jgi:integrase
MIPAQFQDLFGKKVWMIALEGQNDADRATEAHAIADRHNRQMRMAETVDVEQAVKESADAVAMRIDLSPDNLPPDAPEQTPARFLREGQIVEVYRYAVTDDPAQRRAAEADGYFVVSQEEARAQFELQQHVKAFEEAQTPEAAEIADLKAERAAGRVETASRVSGETVLSILPRWREREKQAPTTWKKHTQYAKEFAEFHAGKGSDLHLSEVTKRHVQEYVEHAQTLAPKGKALSPTSITKRLDSVRALLSFAASVDEIEHNPATGVRPPKDNRPKTSRSWKSFEREEIQKLVKVSTDLWTKRRNSKQAWRKEDLMTALQCLIWSGARPEEICQVRRDWVDLDRGVIQITNDETDDNARAAIVKNENSVREVPIHTRLLPFLSEHLRRHNSPLLFPSFEPKPTPAELEAEKKTGVLEIKGRYARPISREWTDNLREIIAPNEPRKVLYSLRHSWAAESRRSGMPEYVRNAIMGHAADNPHAGRYGGDADWLEEKRRHVERMECA